MSSFRRATGAKPAQNAPIGNRSSRLSGLTGHSRALPGTRAWVNGQFVTSSGQEWADRLFGSGLTLGTLTLIEESEAGGHARTLASCFAAQGVLCRHANVVVGVSGRRALPAFVAELPADRHQERASKAGAQASSDDGMAGGSREGSASSANGGGDDGLSIAWQYRKYLAPTHEDGAPTLQAMPRAAHGGTSRATGSGGAGAGSSRRNKLGNTLDLSRVMHANVIAAAPPVVIDVSDVTDVGSSLWRSLLDRIQRVVAAAGSTNLVRVCLLGFMGPLWPVDGKTDADVVRSAARFLVALRSLARKARAVVLITLPHGCQGGASLRRYCEHLCDAVVSLNDFKDVPPGTFDEHNAFREYTGMMEFVKLPRLHSLARHTLDTHRYLFKRERRKFHVEKLHLPPEESRSTSTVAAAAAPGAAGGSSSKAAPPLEVGMSCAASLPGRGGASLDF